MNINRNNYEEYFLLYADNELSQVEKKVVEIFVQENIDLREEFLMIQLTLNSPDEEVKLLDKSFLMKEEPSFINEKNYEEIFVLYYDNELSKDEKNKTEEFVKLHPEFKTEFELFGKLKLTPDKAIVYPGKKQLYRKEKLSKVIPLMFWKAIAAAVLIGFGLWIGLSYFYKKTELHVVVLKGQTIKEEKTIKSLSTGGQNSILEKSGDAKSIATTSTQRTEATIRENKEVINKENKTRKNQHEIANTVATENKKEKILPEEKAVQIKQDNNPEIADANNPIKNISNQIVKPKTSLPTNDTDANKVDESTRTPTYAQNASYKIDENNTDENYVFYHVTTDEFNKTKIGGFLKKMKRIVERNNPINRLLSGEEKQVASN